MTARRAGAPRLIDWTGERAVPWAPDVQVIYEHYHRYLWAQRLVAGLAVLDLGSGEGFGAALLEDAATSVVGVDVDERTVEHARLNYATDTLRFEVGSATDLGAHADASFDAVVAFEVVEHVADQAGMLAEIARVLRPDGLLITSTPETSVYAARENPFHVKELTEAEFRALLGAHFPALALFGQRTATGSKIEPLTPGAGGTALPLHLEQVGDDWREAGGMSPLYLLAVAAKGALPALPGDSALSDFDLRLLREAESHRAAAEGLVREADERVARAQEQVEQATRARAALEADAATWGRERDRLTADVIARAREFDDVLRHDREASAHLEHALAEGEQLRQRLRLIDESVAWKVVQKSRSKVFSAVGGRDALPGRAITASMRGLGRTAAKVTADPEQRQAEALAAAQPLLTLPRFETPIASIVIAAYNGAELTRRCLSAILHATDAAYEVIVVDDAADAETKELLASVAGITVIENEQNLGYLRSVNRGSTAARGKYLVQLNNDTEPQPGWLEALIERAESAADIGIVVPRLLYPSGMLQEAGGIVWQDGGGWNYGKGGDAEAAMFNYVREVDYGSAAALLVRKDLWDELGGFDERFVPGYYEDTDLCFAARDRGYRVMFEPRARVIHVEGASMGTDVTEGGKAHQVLNQVKFQEKWAAALASQHPGPAVERTSLAADRRSASQVIVIDHRVPSPDHDSGSLRIWHLLQNLTELGHQVTLIPDNFAPTQPYTAQLQAMGVQVLYGAVNLTAFFAGIGAAARLAIVSRPYVAPRYVHQLRELLPHVPIAYDTVDLHYVREDRRAELEGNPDRTKAVGLKELEIALARGSDVTLTVSEAEAERLRADAPGIEVRVVPNANHLWPEVPPREGRAGLLFLGGFEHPPNTDAAIFLARRVMPHVWRRLPDMTLTIVGGNAPPEVLRLSAPNVDVAGWVADLDDVLGRSLALVAPLRYGAGVKGKVTQSLSTGLPVITTALGAEGLDARDGRDVLLAEEAEAFAEQIVRLHADPELWAALSASGQELIRRLGSPEVQRDALAGLIAEFGSGARSTLGA